MDMKQILAVSDHLRVGDLIEIKENGTTEVHKIAGFHKSGGLVLNGPITKVLFPSEAQVIRILKRRPLRTRSSSAVLATARCRVMKMRSMEEALVALKLAVRKTGCWIQHWKPGCRWAHFGEDSVFRIRTASQLSADGDLFFSLEFACGDKREFEEVRAELLFQLLGLHGRTLDRHEQVTGKYPILQLQSQFQSPSL